MDWANAFKEILKFFPRIEILNADEGGLFLRCGRLKKVVKAGVHFCFPYFDEIVRYMSATATLDSKNQSITSKDKKHLFVSWSATYTVHDPVKAYLTTDDIADQISSSISARLVEYIGNREYENIKANLIKNHLMQKDFLNEFQDMWGINITGFYLHDLGLHRIFRLVSDRKELVND